MDLVAMRREITRRAIELNPVQIALKRTVKQKGPAGGYEVTETILPPQTFRLFISSNRASREVAKEAVQMQVNQVGLLAMHDADVQRGDTFERDGRTYKVEKVEPVRIRGEIVSVQCALEEVV